MAEMEVLVKVSRTVWVPPPLVTAGWGHPDKEPMLFHASARLRSSLVLLFVKRPHQGTAPAHPEPGEDRLSPLRLLRVSAVSA